MKFNRAVQRYGRTPEAVTPYQRAAQAWDERIGSARVQARNWRLMALGGLALSTALSGGLLWQSTQSRIVPYVVAVDRLGEARAVAPADSGYRPTDPQIAWFLGRFVTNVRSISLDPVLMRQNWISAYDFVTGRGGRFLSAYARQAAPLAGLGTRTVSVQVTNVVRASDRSFQVDWTETQYERGELVGTSHWRAILSLVHQPPRNVETLRKNPLGLYVDSIDWSEELESAPASASATANTVRPPGSPTAADEPQAEPALSAGSRE